MLDKLTVLHLYNYSKPKGKASSLKRFTQQVNPLVLSTCMRHIYLFPTLDEITKQKALDPLLETLNTPFKGQSLYHYDYLKGKEAYAFLLYWAVGGLNHKNRFNDLRILGDLRKILHAEEQSLRQTSKDAWQDNKETALALRLDAKLLLGGMAAMSNEWDEEEQAYFIKKACQQCAWARDIGLLDLLPNINYNVFFEGVNLIEALGRELTIFKNKCQLEIEQIKARLVPLSFLFSETRSHIQLKIDKVRSFQSKLTQNEEALSITLG